MKTQNFFLKASWILAFLLNYSTSIFSQTAGIMTLTYTQSAVGSASKNNIAVWIEDNSGSFVKTRCRYVGNGTKDHLPSWAVKSGGVANNALSTSCNIVDATTGATRSSSTSPTAFGPQSVSWNGTNTSNVVVTDGTYKVIVESAYGSPNPPANTHNFISTFTFTKGSTATTITPSDANISGITIVWTPTNTNTIAAPSISGSPFCQGANLSVPFIASGTFNSGNVFTAQLSNSTGSFSSPTNIGSYIGTVSGSISAIIPNGANAGSGYRIRVIASNPSTIGANNGTNITIDPILTPSIQITTPSNTICNGSPATFTAIPTNGGTASFSWKLNGNSVGSNSSIYTNSSLNNNDTIACLITSTATCLSTPTALSNKIGMSVQSNLNASVSISANNAFDICPNETIEFIAIPVNGGQASYQWELDGTPVSVNDTFTYSFSQNAKVEVFMTTSESCATPSISSYSDSVFVFTIIPIILTADSISITSSSTNGNQWYNVATGIIAGAITQSYSPTESGNYYCTGLDINGCNSVSDTINFIALGINRADANKDFRVYPNPATNILNIRYSDYNNNPNYRIMDISGRVLLKGIVREKEIKIDISALYKGMYFISMGTQTISFIKD